MKNSIDNIYVYKDENNEEIYLYSQKSQSDDLGYEYHLLLKDKNEEVIDKQIFNIIQIFQNQDINIIEVKKNDKNKQYLRFLNYYSKVQEQLKKGKKR